MDQTDESLDKSSESQIDPEELSYNPPESMDLEPPASWEQEKSLLEELLAKNQYLLQSVQQAHTQEKQDLEQQWSRTVAEVTSQLRSCREELRLLKATIEKTKAIGAAGKSDHSIKLQLLEEIEKIEKLKQQREDELLSQIEEGNFALKQARGVATEREQAASEERFKLEQQFEAYKREAGAAQEALRRKLDETTYKLEVMNKSLTRKNEELKVSSTDFEEKLRVILKEKSDSEDRWNGEQQILIAEGNRLSKFLKDKESAIAQQFASLQRERDIAVDHLRQQMQAAMAQKAKIEAELGQIVSLSAQREASLLTEAERLRSLNSDLIKRNKDFESQLLTEMSQQHEALVQLGHDFAEQESALLVKTSDYEAICDRYRSSLSQAILSEDVSMNAHLHSQVSDLMTKLGEKERVLESMRELYLNAKHAERGLVTRALQSYHQFLDNLNAQQESMMAKQLEITEALRRAAEQAAQQDVSSALETKVLQDEVRRLQLALQEFESGNYSFTIDTLRMDLTKTQEDLKMTKSALFTANESLAQLEAMIESKKSSGEEFSCGYAEDIRKMKLEHERLVSENRSLVEAKLAQEEFLVKELERARELLRNKAEALDNLQLRYGKLKAMKLGKDVEDAQVAQKRQMALAKANEQLEEEVKVQSQRLETFSKLQAAKKSLEEEELKLLRIEVTEKEEWLEGFRQTWLQEKQELQAEVERLRASLLAVNDEYEDLKQRLKEQNAIVKDESRVLEEFIKDRKKSNELQLQVKSGLEALKRGLELTFERSSQELVEISQKEVESLRQKIVIEENMHQQELELIRSSTATELSNLQQIESALTKQVSVQQAQIKEMTLLLKGERELHNDEIKFLRSELIQLRKIFGQRSEAQTDPKTAAGEIERLSAVLTREDNETKRSFLDKLKKVQNALEVTVEDKRSLTGIEIRQLLDEVRLLRSLEEERNRQRTQEKDTMRVLVSRIQDALSTFQYQSSGEKEALRRENLLLSSKVDALQAECDSLRKQAVKPNRLKVSGEKSEMSGGEVRGLEKAEGRMALALRRVVAD